MSNVQTQDCTDTTYKGIAEVLAAFGRDYALTLEQRLELAQNVGRAITDVVGDSFDNEAFEDEATAY